MSQNNRHIELVLHNIRSAHNVGALLRTADGLAITHVYLSGYTPYPALENDDRLPHIALKTTKQIAKTALGAEQSVQWSKHKELSSVADKLQVSNTPLVALEQTPSAVALHDYDAPDKLALVLGNEVDGLSKEELALCEQIVELPMLGSKESYNVASAGAMALHWLRFYRKI